MDYKDPKTRSEKKGKDKAKDKAKAKGPYSTKHVRIAQALQESKIQPNQKALVRVMKT
jgi:hypothetical protein